MSNRSSFLLGTVVGILSGFILLGTFLNWMAPSLVSAIIQSGIHYIMKDGEQPEEEKTEEVKKDMDWKLLDVKTKAIYSVIEENFLNKIEPEKLQDSIYRGMVNGLEDPYSVYYNKEEYDKFNESTSGTYYGIGVMVQQNPTTSAIKVVKTFKKGSSHKAGVLAEDIIIKVDGKSIEGEDLSKVVTKIKGKEGTFVKITVLRQGKELEFNLKRTKLEVDTVEYELLKRDRKNIGYISVLEFDGVTTGQFREALDDLERQGMEGLVVDLRDNPGGRLDTVVEMLDRMLPKGLLVYTLDKDGEKIEDFSDDKESFKKPVSVLINENSASASEIFAGAMQDYKAGEIVGKKSFGKGIVQSILGLGDGSAVKLTVSKYYTPNGRNIHGTGINPDVEVELDRTKIKDGKLLKEEDSQLKKAIEVVIDKLDK